MDTTSLTCKICKKDFSKRGNLKAHIKKFHPSKLEELPPKKTIKCAALCNACNKTFVKYSNLTQHVKKFHKDKLNELLKPKHYTYECDKCQRHFSHLRHFKNHMKCHQEHNSSGLKCTLCKNNKNNTSDLECFLKSDDLFKHFQEKHDVNVVTEMFEFSNLEEFENWKRQEERKTNELFVCARGSYKTKKYTNIAKYVCHRSGTYKSKGSGLRHLKTQGSKKINGFCPAEMSVKTIDGKCKVKYVKTHIGHSSELGHLHLTETERRALAAQIASKIPLETILDQVRESVCNGGLERSHLLTKKDLCNIERSFNINCEALKHKNDAISVDAWVKEMEDSGCVLFYKPQDECCEYTQLKTEDFALIIMNQGQTEMMEKYGHDCICVDETHGLNAYHFNLTTVLVLDDMREGFPCCFLISNRSDEEMMYIFFKCIRDKLGRPLQAKVFMSDMAQAFYNAWIRVMELPLYRLYCTWHIDRAWRNNLNKVNSKEKQVVTYKQLRSLLQETDSTAFSTMIQKFLTNLLTDPDTAQFGHYFQEHYVKAVEAWAYCYRINAGINTNMHIENMHRSIKYIYLNGKVNKRLDKCVHVLMKFVRDKLFGRLIVLNKGKVSAKLKDLRARHKSSITLDINSVLRNETGWMVTSSSSDELYKIEERQTDCDCKLVCTFCETCIHRYTCSCLDSCIKWNMCKHIHLVCRFLKESANGNGNPQLSQYSENTLDLTIDEAVCKQEELQIIEALSKTKTNLNETQLSGEKEILKLQWLQTIDSVTCSEELDVLKKIFLPFRLL